MTFMISFGENWSIRVPLLLLISGMNFLSLLGVSILIFSVCHPTLKIFRHLQTVSLPCSIWEAAFVDDTYQHKFTPNIIVDDNNAVPSMSTEFLAFSRDSIQLYVLVCEKTDVDTTFVLHLAQQDNYPSFLREMPWYRLCAGTTGQRGMWLS
jgi:hypothetical protein